MSTRPTVAISIGASAVGSYLCGYVAMFLWMQLIRPTNLVGVLLGTAPPQLIAGAGIVVAMGLSFGTIGRLLAPNHHRAHYLAAALFSTIVFF